MKKYKVIEFQWIEEKIANDTFQKRVVVEVSTGISWQEAKALRKGKNRQISIAH